VANFPRARGSLDAENVHWIWRLGCSIRINGFGGLRRGHGVRITAESQEYGNKLLSLVPERCFVFRMLILRGKLFYEVLQHLKMSTGIGSTDNVAHVRYWQHMYGNSQ
jgi:hypothetical protein